MRRPMIAGGLIIAVLVLGLGVWASVTPLSTGITAQGEVRVESNKKTLKHQQSGTVRRLPERRPVVVRSTTCRPQTRPPMRPPLAR